MTSDATGAGYATFATAIGWCGLAWTDAGIVRVGLPEPRESALRAHLARRVPGAHERRPTEAVASVVARIVALLDGEAVDLSDVALDLEAVDAFPRQVYAVARGIPPGATLTYGDVATRLGAPGAARAVGRALGQNPVPIIVPCHRVVAAHGGLGGFSAPGGAATKRRILAIEGALAPTLFDAG